MNDSTFSYPEFKEGQVLTHNDLNLLRDYLYTKSMFHGRALFGFGVGCGLEGTLAGATLTVGTGFALAQGGRELRLDAATTIPLGAPAADPAVYAFIDAAKGGYTPVLRPRDSVRPAGGTCDANGCTTHTEIHDEGVEIVLVAGQLRRDPLLDAAVFDLRPIDPKTNKNLTGFGDLRDALREALKNLLDPATLDLLTSAKLKLEGPPGLDLRKVGLVNEVLYTARDYFLCRVGENALCGGVTAPPAAVALGWLLRSGTTWTWDQRFRHHFQLSLPLFRGMRGYLGESPCGRYLDHIRALLESFEPAPAPPPAGNGNQPQVDVCKIRRVVDGSCEHFEQLDLSKFIDPTRYLQQEPPRRDPGEPVYLVDDSFVLNDQILVLDPADQGLSQITNTLGWDATVSAEAILAAAVRAGTTATVNVVTMAEFDESREKKGVEPALVASMSDTIYLGKDENDVVVATGVIPTSTALGEVTAVAESARNAELVANGISGRVTTVENNFTTFSNTLTDQFRTFTGGFQGLDVDGIRQLQTTVVNLQADLTVQSDRVLGLAERSGTLEQRSNAFDTRIDGISRRFDVQAVTRRTPDAERTSTLNASLYQALDAMRDAIAAGATRRAGPSVRRKLADVSEQFEVLQREAVGTAPLLEAHPEAVTGVMEGVVLALTAMGLAQDSQEFKDLTESVNVLKSQIGMR